MQPGAVLGPYFIDRELGSGGMGKVYAATAGETARAVAPGTRVALKIVHPHLLETGDAVERFRREVAIGQTVDHPNVVRTFGGGAADGHHYLAMEYVEGQTLEGLLDELERVPEELCRHIGREVCKGLSAIHAVGAIHRDMKPENVLITPDHVVKIMDLGVARSTDDALRLSQTGAFVGSLQYACPEQFKGGGKGLDGRVDLHALGLVLYELASGKCPFVAEDIPQVVRKVLHEEPRRLGELNPQLSAFYEEVVHCLLAKDRDERFATAGDLRAALDAGEDSGWWHERARALQLTTKRPIRRVRIPRETAVYGREGELEKLRALYDRAKSGDGNVVLIEGEAGIGKSRLVDELIGRLQQEGEDINFLFGGYPPGGAATVEGGFSSAYRGQFGAAGSAAFLPENQVLVPAFDALLRGEGAPPDAQALNKGSLQTCFARATQALAAERVTVVLIDDLHFAPEEGRALFTSLAMALSGHQVLLIGTVRPGVAEDWMTGLTRLDQATHLALHRLGPADLVRLLQDTLQSEHLARDLGDQIAVKSDGNPFFVFEILRGLREGQFITQTADGTWIGTKLIEEIQIPSSVRDLIDARIADLTDQEKELLDAAACCGFEFDPGLVAEAIGMRRIPALRAFGSIEKSRRLVRSSGRRMVFDHHQVQETLYVGQLEQLREEYHAALAETLEARTNAADQDPESLDGALCVELCEHYFKGARGESALRYLPAAQAHLTRSYLHAQVASLGERALAVPDLLTGTERAEALLRVATALHPMARRAREEECAREAERLAVAADDDELLGRTATSLGRVLLHTARFAEADAAFSRALEIARARGDRNSENAVTTNLGNVSLTQGRFAEAEDHYERSAAFSREIGDRRSEAHAAGSLGRVFRLLGRLSEAQEHSERSIEISRDIGDRESEAAATVNLGIIFNSMGRVPEAQEALDRGIVLSREVGHRQFEANAASGLGHVFWSLGRLLEAQRQIERSLALFREVGFPMGEAIARVNLGPLLLALGDRGSARQHLEASLAVSREIGARDPEGHALAGLGAVAAEEGDGVAATTWTEQSLALRRELGQRTMVAASLIALGELRRRWGDVEGARAALEEAVPLSSQLGRKSDAAHALALLACLPAADAKPGDAKSGDATAAEAALADAEESDNETSYRTSVRLLLWQATADRAHLAEAKRLLDESLAKVPAEYHEAMLTNLRVNREIMAAWNAGSGGD